jgi:UDP:flavonoid glycosyltransferase YjiC (YdhE family)
MDLDQQEKSQLAEDATAAADTQGYKLLVLGIDGPTTAQAMYYPGFIPYEAIFPFAAFTIQHGGSGTIHGSMQAGVPIIVVPFLADQPDWYRRAQQLGFGLGGVPYIDLTRQDLSTALAELRQSQPPMKQIVQRYAQIERQLPDTYRAILEILAG